MLMQEETTDQEFQVAMREQFVEGQTAGALQRVRNKAWDQYLNVGLPTRKTEVYGYIRLRSLVESAFKLAEPSAVDAAAIAEHIYPECKASVIVMVNGQYSPELSDTSALPSSVVVQGLEQAARPYGTFLNNRWTQTLKEDKDPFALLNLAMHREGVFIYLPPKQQAEAPLQILNVIDVPNDHRLVMPRVQIFVGAHSELKVQERTLRLSGEGFFSNGVLDVALEDNAKLKVTGFTMETPEDAWSLKALRATLKRDSKLDTFSVTDGSRTVREDYAVALMGENGDCRLRGAWLLDGKRESHTNIFMHHQAPNCHSTQHFKGVLNGVSRSSFEGKIYVDSIAQKTDAFQLNHNLLLSDGAEANTKPNLEIFADDVKASHGATVGQLAPEPLFYLQARGLTLEAARAMLIRGYLEELVEHVEAPSQQEELHQHINRLLDQ